MWVNHQAYCCSRNTYLVGYSELIIFLIEVHSDSTLFGALGFISGYGWASKFCFNSKPRLSIAKWTRKNTSITSTFRDFLEAECSNPSVGRYQNLKLCNFTTSSLGSSKHTQKHLFLQNNQKITNRHFFLQVRMMSFNSSLLLTNHRPPYTK